MMDKIISAKDLELKLQLENGVMEVVNMKEFLNKVTPDLSSPYRKILEPGVFEKVYLINRKLIWDDVLEIVMCGGDTKWMAAEFTLVEILAFKKEKTGQTL